MTSVITEFDDTKFCYQLIGTISKFVIFLAFLKLKQRIFFIPRILASSKKKKEQSSARLQWRVLSNYLAKGQVMEVCQHASQVNRLSIVMIKAVKVKKVFFFKSNVMLHQ